MQTSDVVIAIPEVQILLLARTFELNAQALVRLSA